MIDKLEMFMVLAREQHFGHAAEECGVTQPTLSSAIRQLEEQLGVMLVRRGSRFQGLTLEGERVLDWARHIVGSARSMRDEMRAMRLGLTGKVKIAVIPTALAMVQELTTPFREKHPDITFSILSRTSGEIRTLLENLEVDAGITYLDNEPVGRVTKVPLYDERYLLVTSIHADDDHKDSITWHDASKLPLCLLTSDMQNRRIIDGHLAEAGAEANPTLVSDSMIALFSHVQTGNWASIMPEKMIEAFGLPDRIRAIPITDPDATHQIGLIAVNREPATPVVSALLKEAARISTLV
ncbi:DNA-binding transcriptional LysR family regulator [Thalassospira sp. MBR-102]|jgi:DNA-binding transcriptional LysR family regulator|uniref:LysR family transcriptional regulator n=1 Tax=Thalassospira sp. MBR-102 TaxID=3156466 RepID=UPI0033978B00